MWAPPLLQFFRLEKLSNCKNFQHTIALIPDFAPVLLESTKHVISYDFDDFIELGKFSYGKQGVSSVSLPVQRGSQLCPHGSDDSKFVFALNARAQTCAAVRRHSAPMWN